MKVKLEEVVYFSTAEELMVKLSELDQAFLEKAYPVDYEEYEERTLLDGGIMHARITFVAETDASL